MEYKSRWLDVELKINPLGIPELFSANFSDKNACIKETGLLQRGNIQPHLRTLIHLPIKHLLTGVRSMQFSILCFPLELPAHLRVSMALS